VKAGIAFKSWFVLQSIWFSWL